MGQVTGEYEVPARATRREWVGLAVLTLAALVYAMDLTVLNLAIPRISAELRPTSAQLLWIIDIYGFLVAGLLITMGTLGDRIGRRKLLLGGAAGFALASLLAAFSTSPEMLIASRAIMGIAGATIAPSTLSLIFTMFLDPKQRSTAIGFWIAAYSAGSAIGPVIGGVLLEFFWWGSVFLIGVPVMGLLLILGPRTLPEYRDPDARRLDLASAVLSLGRHPGRRLRAEGDRAGRDRGRAGRLDHRRDRPGDTVRASPAAPPLADHRRAPLPDPRVQRITRYVSPRDLRRRRLLPVHRAVPPARPGAVTDRGGRVVASVGDRLHRRFDRRAEDHSSLPPVGDHGCRAWRSRRPGPRSCLASGLDAGTGIPLIVVASIVISLGLAPVITLATELIVGSAPPEQAGAATGMSETSGELGGALGIAILGSLGTAVYRTRGRGIAPVRDPSGGGRRGDGHAWRRARDRPDAPR